MKIQSNVAMTTLDGRTKYQKKFQWVISDIDKMYQIEWGNYEPRETKPSMTIGSTRYIWCMDCGCYITSLNQGQADHSRIKKHFLNRVITDKIGKGEIMVGKFRYISKDELEKYLS